MKAVIRGAGVVGAFGCGLQSLAEALRRPAVPRPDPQGAMTANTDLLDRLIPPRTLRRVEHYGRMGLLAAHLAIESAGLRDGGVPQDMGLVVATGMGPTANTLDLQAADIPLADLSLSPILFSNSVQNAAAAYISMLLGVRGPSLSINQYELAVPLAFQTALDWMEEGRTQTVLVGSIDGFSKALHAQALACSGRGDGESEPESVPAGEGSAFFVLTTADTPGDDPVVEQVRIGGASAPPVENSLVLQNGSRGPGPAEGHLGRINLAHVYGDFPTSMGMDVAAAGLLLRDDSYAPSLPRARRVCCLKETEGGEWGALVVARST